MFATVALVLLGLFSTPVVVSRTFADKIVAPPRFEDGYYGSRIGISGQTAMVNGPHGFVYLYERNALGQWFKIKKLMSASVQGAREYGDFAAIHDDLLAIKSSHTSIDIHRKEHGGNSSWGKTATISLPANLSVYDVKATQDLIYVMVHDQTAVDWGFHLYKRTVSGWTKVVERSMPNPSSYYRATLSVNRLLLSTHQESEGYLYEQNHGGVDNWGLASTLQSPSGSSQWFGSSVCMGDGWLAIGDPGHSSSLEWSGALYVYRHDGVSWQTPVKLLPEVEQEGGRFGTACSLSGSSLVTSGHRVNDEVFLYHYELGQDIVRDDLGPFADRSTTAGSAMAVSIDNNSIFVGFPNLDNNTGIAKILRVNPVGWHEEATVHSEHGTSQRKFGHQLSLGSFLAVSEWNLGRFSIFRTSSSGIEFDAWLTIEGDRIINTAEIVQDGAMFFVRGDREVAGQLETFVFAYNPAQSLETPSGAVIRRYQVIARFESLQARNGLVAALRRNTVHLFKVDSLGNLSSGSEVGDGKVYRYALGNDVLFALSIDDNSQMVLSRYSITSDGEAQLVLTIDVDWPSFWGALSASTESLLYWYGDEVHVVDIVGEQLTEVESMQFSGNVEKAAYCGNVLTVAVRNEGVLLFDENGQVVRKIVRPAGSNGYFPGFFDCDSERLALAIQDDDHPNESLSRTAGAVYLYRLTDQDGDGVYDDDDTDEIDPFVCFDSDGDGCDDCAQQGRVAPDLDGPDLDKDGICDAADKDQDGDGLWDDSDNCPKTHNPKQADHDSDGLGDVCEDDANLSVSGGGCRLGGDESSLALAAFWLMLLVRRRLKFLAKHAH